MVFIDVVQNDIDYSSTVADDILKGGGKRALHLNKNVTFIIFDNGRKTNWEQSKLFNVPRVNLKWILE